MPAISKGHLALLRSLQTTWIVTYAVGIDQERVRYAISRTPMRKGAKKGGGHYLYSSDQNVFEHHVTRAKKSQKRTLRASDKKETGAFPFVG